jgi:guanylate kinase
VSSSQPDMSTPRGRLFVIAAPSGAGKTSLVKALLERRPQLRLSVSHTTRPPRANEVEGREYFFVPVEKFRELAAQRAFLEHAQVFDNHYGTGRAPVEADLASGRSVILEIDWQGARQVRASLPQCVSIFILPPSRGALEKRLRARRTESDVAIERRLRDAVGDMSHWTEFDYVVVNDDFERALEDLTRIVDSQGDQLRADRPALTPLIAELLA